ncbi:P-loop containing nucleoside triphosphate hydrolase protein [Dichomitus squalens]|uniref:P-loop containing nucleoside triphosphate hydrolase protein n=1 Tax=Dichomitus squalens TaxID=114155 RepID=A0A4Q9P5L0_9APHY|nr:P-loop containing nucleoside triphosphate hydrolase protein [Dichomitus squalens]TBU55803.1 P-loop containing nucleoside triphosphate hydrolase protein [Dichomitus squalens]
MTSLRTFQTEIDEISHREVAKQRAHATAERAKLEKDAKKPTAAKAHARKESNTTEVVEPAPKEPIGPAGAGNGDAAMSDIDEQLQTLLLSRIPENIDTARNLIASLLTRNFGEYVFRIGAHPPNPRLFAGQPATEEASWQGTRRTAEELDVIIEETTTVVDEVGGKTSVLFDTRADSPRAALLLRLPPRDVASTPEVRCAVVGNVDSGKSTTLGVLTRGQLDDGRGRARVSLFRHKHEIESGRTSSVGMEILGFGPTGKPILPNTAHSNDPEVIRHEKMGWEEISIQASKIISFSDLAGHERYLKTTLYGLTSGSPSCVILIVGGNAGLIGMSKEHLAIALALSVPVVVCITKIDMTPPNVLAKTVEQVSKILRSPGCRKTPVFVKSMEAAVTVAQLFGKERLAPVFQTSNVTGEGLDFLRTFLNLLPASEGDHEKFLTDQPLEYSITEVYSVPYVGTVVDGILNSGTVKSGDVVLFGPDSNGNFHNTVIKSIERKRARVASAEAGQCVSFALKRVRRADIRKGMVLVHKTDAPPKAVRQFEGQVLILYHNTTLQRNYQAMLHCGAVRQTVRIVSMDHPQGILRTGDRATVTFEFISRPEFIKEGMKLLFREGKTKGLGVITRLL